jgi:PAS domain S-box-containing protein
MLDASLDAIIEMDGDGLVVEWNRAACRIFGYPREDAIGRSLSGLIIPPALREDHERGVARVVGGGKSAVANRRMELVGMRSDGSEFPVELSITQPDAHKPHFIGFVRDITERKLADKELRRFAAMVTSSDDAIYGVSPAGVIFAWNAGAEHLYGFVASEAVGHALAELIMPPDQVADFERVQARVLRDRVSHHYEAQRLCKGGAEVDVALTVSPMVNVDGEVDGLSIMARDISESQRAIKALTASEQRLRAILENTPAVVYVKAGPDLRYDFANREFEEMFHLEPGAAVGLRDEDFRPPEVVDAVRVTDRQVLETCEPVSQEESVPRDGAVRSYISVKFPLVNEAGDAYAVCGISTDITERKRAELAAHERLDWEARIRGAIQDDLLLVYAQPIMDLQTGETVQQELFVRMVGREPGEVILPGEFLPQAERLGVINLIDRWMVAQAMRLLAQGQRVEVNLSALSMSDPTLCADIATEVEQVGAPAHNLIFEITETAAMENLETAREFSERLARIGCRLALDDFGTGYGSFTYLRSLPAQFLKIDRSFITNLGKSRGDQDVVQSIVAVAAQFGQKTIAEGVEDEETCQLLRAYGVHYAQGYHFAKPAPVDF